MGRNTYEVAGLPADSPVGAIWCGGLSRGFKSQLSEKAFIDHKSRILTGRIWGEDIRNLVGEMIDGVIHFGFGKLPRLMRGTNAWLEIDKLCWIKLMKEGKYGLGQALERNG